MMRTYIMVLTFQIEDWTDWAELVQFSNQFQKIKRGNIKSKLIGSNLIKNDIDLETSGQFSKIEVRKEEPKKRLVCHLSEVRVI